MALISFAVNAKLICAFVFAYADCWFSHGVADLFFNIQKTGVIITKLMLMNNHNLVLTLEDFLVHNVD